MAKSIFFTILALILFAGCNSETAKLSSISKITAGFETGSAASFPGGLLVVGVRTDTVDKAVFSFPSGVPTTLRLEHGDWEFFSFGYSATTPNPGIDDRHGKFANLTHCGYTRTSFRNGKSTQINLNLSTIGCAGKLVRDTKLDRVIFRPCSALYNYPLSGPYAFNSFTWMNDSCYNIPQDQRGDVGFYRIVSMNYLDGVLTDGLEGPCFNNPVTAGYARQIPTAIAPFKVKLFRSRQACEGNSVVHNTLLFENGIQSGSTSFASIVTPDYGGAGTYSAVTIPEHNTGQYTSPFINLIPRFFCNGTPECFAKPNINSRSAVIPFTSYVRDQLVMKDIDGRYTCEDFRHTSKYFSFGDCKIRNNSLYATVRRNPLSCKDSAAAAETYQDLYYRNGFIYQLYTDGANQNVRVLKESGEEITIFATDSGDYDSIVADDSGNIFLGNKASGNIKTWTKTGSYTYTISPDVAHLFPAGLEVSENGNLVFAAENFSAGGPPPTLTTTISVVTRSDLNDVVDTLSLPLHVQKMHFSNGYLYVYIATSAGAGDGQVKRISVTDEGYLGNPADVFQYGAVLDSFDINKGKFYYLDNEGIGNGDSYETGYYRAINSPDATSNFGAHGVDKFIVIGNMSYGIKTDSPGIFSQNRSSIWVYADSIDSCAESFTTYFGAFENYLTRHDVTFYTSKVPDNTSKNANVIHAAYSLLGRNQIEYDSYFSVLNMQQNRNTSGGLLRLPQRLLGPQGVGGMLATSGATCGSVVGPLYLTKGITDPYRGYKSYAVTVSPNTDLIPPFLCNDSTFGGACAGERYSLRIQVSSQGLFEKESYDMKLSCTSKVGQINYQSVNGTENMKEQVYWNTTNESGSRADLYSYYTDGERKFKLMGLLFNNGTTGYRGRVISQSTWPDQARYSITDYQTDSSHHYVRFNNITCDGVGCTPGGYTGPYGSEADFTGNSQYRLSLTATDLSTAPDTSGTFSSINGVGRAKPLVLKMDEINIDATYINSFNSFP